MRVATYLKCSSEAVDHLVRLNVTICVYVQSMSSLSQGTDCLTCEDLFMVLVRI